MSLRVLIVEPEPRIRAALQYSVRPLADVEAQARFESARRLVSTRPFDFIVSNVRLGDFNGLHLVYLSSDVQTPPRCIVYTVQREPLLAREVQRAGAFYETADCLPITIAAYLAGRLPETDRRDPEHADRRLTFRGGRRCWDQHLLSAGPSA
jgi:DNA-binding NtrC family response regulator